MHSGGHEGWPASGSHGVRACTFACDPDTASAACHASAIAAVHSRPQLAPVRCLRSATNLSYQLMLPIRGPHSAPAAAGGWRWPCAPCCFR